MIPEEVFSRTLLDFFAPVRAYLDDPSVPGGCPILNTAVEADDTYPALRERAQAAMTNWHKLIGATVLILRPLAPGRWGDWPGRRVAGARHLE